MRRDVMCCAGSRKLESFHEVFARGADIVGCSVPDAGSSESGGKWTGIRDQVSLHVLASSGFLRGYSVATTNDLRIYASTHLSSVIYNMLTDQDQQIFLGPQL